MKKVYNRDNSKLVWENLGYKFDDRYTFRDEQNAIFHGKALEYDKNEVVILRFGIGSTYVYKVGYKKED